MNKSAKPAFYSLIFIFLASISAITFNIERYESGFLGIAYFSAFFSYFWLIKLHSDSKFLFPLGIISHLLMFITLPTLSDDIYRFIWDGRLLDAGIDPYAQIPEYYLEYGKEIIGISQSLFDKLNSPQYFTVYPPLNQLIFWISVKIGGDNLLLSTNVIRLIILMAEIGSFIFLQKILRKNRKPPELAFWFLLNPLVILEFTGNVHFEAIVIFFLMLGFYYLKKGNTLIASLSFGGAIAAKLLPLIYLPALLFSFKWKKGLLICTIALIIAGITFVPLLSSDLFFNLQNSLELYFKKFEFNASIYFIIREIGFFFTGYNIIETLGPSLSIVTFLLILAVSLYGSTQKWRVEKTALFVLTIHLLLATTVHPWYVLALVPLGIISGYYYPVFWTFIVFCTYFGYNQAGFELSSIWIVLEYVSLFLFIFVESIFRKHDPIT